MTPSQREQIRLSVIRYCVASGQWGLMEAVLLQELRNEGLRALTRDDLSAELQYLADKDLIVSTDKLISPELKRWRATAAGRDVVAELTGE
jgi:hypothetical protein